VAKGIMGKGSAGKGGSTYYACPYSAILDCIWDNVCDGCHKVVRLMVVCLVDYVPEQDK
jgi:hypothetical protein